MSDDIRDLALNSAVTEALLLEEKLKPLKVETKTWGEAMTRERDIVCRLLDLGEEFVHAPERGLDNRIGGNSIGTGL